MIVVQTQEQSQGHPLGLQWQRTHFHFRGRHLEAQLQFHPEVPLDVPHQLQAIMLGKFEPKQLFQLSSLSFLLFIRLLHFIILIAPKASSV